MNVHRFCVGVLSGLFALSMSSSGQVPNLINYQGRLLNGTNLVNGNVGLSLRLFNVPSGGASIYEDSNSVVVADGLYSTFIGDNPTDNSFLTALTNAAVYVEVAVNGVALAPRERLASVGYSLATRGLLVTTNSSFVVNPAVNTVDPFSLLSTIGGGYGNSIQVTADQSFLGGGSINSIQTNAFISFLGGGYGNNIQANAYYSFLGGGNLNSIQTSAYDSFLGGGESNNIQTLAHHSFLGGGYQNSVQTNAAYSVLSGGEGNSIQYLADHSFLGGGSYNSIQAGGFNSFLGGGSNNSIQIDADQSFLGGGGHNTIQLFADYAFLGGGRSNTIGSAAIYAVIPGGRNNSVGNGAVAAFAAGYRAKANHQGTFVWADYQEADFASTAANQFLIRASGGVGIGTPSPAAQLTVVASTTNAGENTAHFSAPAIGPRLSHIHWGTTGDWYIRSAASTGTVILQDSGGNVGIGTATPTNMLQVGVNGAWCNGLVWQDVSDVNRKENFAAVDAAEILQRVSDLPVTYWNYKDDVPGVRHIGPTAQDFHRAFTVGDNDTSLSSVDRAGVALAAIQELVRQNKQQSQEIKELRDRLNAIAP